MEQWRPSTGGNRDRGQREQEQDQDLFFFLSDSHQAQTRQAVTLTGTGERIKELRGEAKRLAGKPGNLKTWKNEVGARKKKDIVSHHQGRERKRNPRNSPTPTQVLRR